MEYDDLPDPIDSGEECIAQLEEAVDLMKSVVRELQSLTVGRRTDMARPRKNAARAQDSLLTPDEVAQIPVEEQPYPLPEGWKWVRLGDAAEIVMGQSPSGADTTDDSSYTPLIGGASDMGQLYPEATKYTKRPTKLSDKNDIIVCIRATLGRPVFSNGEYCLGRGVAAIRSNKIFNQFTRFLFINFEQYLYDNATGTTFAQVNSDTLNKMPHSFTSF